MRLHIIWTIAACVIALFAGAALVTQQQSTMASRQTALKAVSDTSYDYVTTDYYTVYRCTNPVQLGRKVVCDEDLSMSIFVRHLEASLASRGQPTNQSVLFQHDGWASSDSYQPL
jgi:hypothetical protein